MEIHKVGSESIAAIHSLAHSWWPQAYREILSAEQIAYMLELIYSEASLQSQVEEKKHQFIIATKDTHEIGFASYSQKDTLTPSVYRLHKIYVLPGLHGKGIGQLLLDFIVDDIRPRGATDLELNVNRYNKARTFYEKNGFKVTREEDNSIGNGYFMNDFVMNLTL